MIDAAGDPHGDSAGALGYDERNIGNVSMDPVQALVVDLDHAGLDDLVVLGAGGSPVFRCLNNGDGTEFACDAMTLGPYDVISAGKVGATALVVAAGKDKLDLLIPQTAGSFEVTSLQTSLDPDDADRTPVAVEIGTRGIQVPVIAVAYANGPNLRVVENPFGSKNGISVPLPSPRIRTRLAFGDIRTGDNGAAELIAVQGTGTISVYQDDPIAMVGATVGGVIDHLVVGAFIAGVDGVGCFVEDSEGAGGNRGEVIVGSSFGLGGNIVQFGQGIVPDDLHTGRMDADTLPDIVALSHTGNGTQLDVFRGVSDLGAFPHLTIPVEGNPRRFSLGDLNGDGKDDILLLPPRPGGGGVDYLLSR